MGDIQFNGTPEEWDALVEKNKKQEEAKVRAKNYMKLKSGYVDKQETPEENKKGI